MPKKIAVIATALALIVAIVILWPDRRQSPILAASQRGDYDYLAAIATASDQQFLRRRYAAQHTASVARKKRWSEAECMLASPRS